MTTSDGISTEDWDSVHELTVAIANAVTEEARATTRRRLLKLLEQLEGKYGLRPSILATRADFIGDLAKKTECLQRAYRLAEARGDGRNVLYVAHSLAELYIEAHRDPVEGRRWLDCLRRGLGDIDDAWFADEHERLLHIIHELDAG